MKKVISVRVDDALFTKVEKLDESKSEVVSKALTSYLLQPDDQQQSKQLAQFYEVDIKEILAIMHGFSETQLALFTRMDDIEKKFFSLEQKFFNATTEMHKDFDGYLKQASATMTAQKSRYIPTFPK